jgi:hypothetical protein
VNTLDLDSFALNLVQTRLDQWRGRV